MLLILVTLVGWFFAGLILVFSEYRNRYTYMPSNPTLQFCSFAVLLTAVWADSLEILHAGHMLHVAM